jgi:predicted PurR-regulated permease PerM
MDPDLYRRGFLRLIPPGYRSVATSVLDDARQSLRHWLIGQTLIALYIGITSGIVFWLLGLPHAAALGLIAGLLEFVPYIGGLIASMPALLVALSTGDPWMFLWVALACLVIQQLEGNLLSPLIQQWAVRLPAVVGLFAMIALGTIFGPLGVLLATPLTVVTIVLVKHLYVALLLRDPSILDNQSAAP